ncbi:cell wall synthase accessory phosphoprotein MacP [Streptococcus sp. zg-JUN1979]|uniref:cell wall synthase accessory phosphoprotein MacP n=1 Tax=Streptococcus sp. zg-JUN1979 TaxID=3391450 RepID=UPI0039A6DECE
MGKPLLTDDIIEEAKQAKNTSEDRAYKTEQPIYKSRRIEQEKRKAFRRKLNMILVVVLLLLCALIYAVFNW